MRGLLHVHFSSTGIFCIPSRESLAIWEFGSVQSRRLGSDSTGDQILFIEPREETF